ncbi:MAG TPA: cupredoxin domain-containing protein [Micrococcaceae bacterium]|jgi:plastocyanin|nr:cupredoxin domain-containing protein [Micrococcaceae bacterium]
MRQISKRATYAAAAAAVLLLAGCSSGGGAAAPAAPASQAPSVSTGGSGQSGQAAVDAITIKDFGYQAPTSVAPGSTVTVTNMDPQSHTVTSDDGSSFDAVVAGDGGTATFKAPTKPGTYKYHCTYHGNMHGTLVVK